MPAEFDFELFAPAVPFWTAFLVLSQGRTIGGGMVAQPNPIAVSEILTYAAALGLPMEDTVTLVQLLDQTWLARAARALRQATTPKAGTP